jgi:hypothetical protein
MDLSGVYLIGLIRLFIALSKMLFIRMIGPVTVRTYWVILTEHAAQCASLEALPHAPYRVSA